MDKAMAVKKLGEKFICQKCGEIIPVE